MFQRLCCAALLLAAVGCATVPDAPVLVDVPTEDPAYPAEAKALPTAEERLAAHEAIRGYRFGEDREALSVVEDQVTAAMTDEDAAAAYAAALVAFVQGEATHDAKVFAFRQLARVGHGGNARDLAAFLQDPALADMARYALEGIPGREADEALIEALDTTEGNLRIGVINSLGERRSEAAVPALSALIDDDDEAISAAAKNALVKIQQL